MIELKKAELKPLLRWAGGKTWLSRQIEAYLPKKFINYHEPFIGSGAIFIALYNKKLLNNGIFLSDSNKELIETYEVIRDQPTRLINYLKNYQNEKEFYYNIRRTIPKSRILRAARFIYLNRTSFNGLYRVNLNGDFNVPFGNKNYKELFNFKLIHLISDKLKGINISTTDFEKTLNNIKKDDLIFIDPPYTVAHNNNGFIRYNQKLFSIEDQYRLKKYAEAISDRKAFYIITNAHHENIYNIFNTQAYTYEVTRYSGISGSNTSRQYIKEYIFTNYEVFIQ